MAEQNDSGCAKPTTDTSTGHSLSESAYLDSHFEAMKPEYEEMLRWVGMQPGWKVLDAGCGGGSYLPLLSELVGPSGNITAHDLAPENIERVDSLVREKTFCCQVQTRVGNLVSLPYEDDSFDAVWCANTTQYLTNEELEKMLAEFRRVVKPGGLIAVKEFDITAHAQCPFDPSMVWRLCNEARNSMAHMDHNFRALELPVWLKGAELVDTKYKTFLSERKSPLRSVERAFITSIFQFQADAAEKISLPEKDKTFWRDFRNVNSQNHILNSQDLYFREGHIVVTGVVPKSV